jgi:AcrR family transcriptional regulator
MQRRLLDATIRLLIERGYPKFRTADVATKAKVSRGALLHHFRNKDALIVAALEDLYRTTTAASDKRLGSAGSELSIKHVIEDSEAYYYADEFLALVELALAAGGNRALAHKIKHVTYSSRQPLEERWARKLADQGIPLQDARDAVWIAQAVIRGLRIRKLVAHDRRQVDRVRDLTLQLLEIHIRRPNPSADDCG